MDFKETAIKLAAEKLLRSLRQLEGAQTDTSRRRWIWELIQNAYDTAISQPDHSLNVEVIIAQGQDAPVVRFRHDGPPFHVKHLEALVMVNSPKGTEEGEEGATGRFGSGFITTYLLANRVTVTGDVTNGDGRIPFSLLMDRDPTAGMPGLIERIEKNAGEVQGFAQILMGEERPVASSQWSAFAYPLDAAGEETVKVGLGDLDRSVVHLLGFNPRLASVRVERLGSAARYTGTGMAISERTRRTVVVVERGGAVTSKVQIALTAPIEIEGDAGSLTLAVLLDPTPDPVDAVAELPDDLPRLFRRFPLIGSEVLRLPFVLESTYFEVTEPRTGIELKGSGDAIGPAVERNKQLLSALPDLYERVLAEARDAGLRDLWLLLLLPDPERAPWLDDAWYRAEILAPLRQKATSVAVVPTLGEGDTSDQASLSGEGAAVIPAQEGGTETLWELLAATPYAPRLVLKNEVETWRRVRKQLGDAQGVPKLFTAAMLVKEVASKGNLNGLAGWLGVGEDEAAAWLNHFVLFLDGQESPLRDLLVGSRRVLQTGGPKDLLHNPILPNQEGRFRPRANLASDARDTPEALKDITEQLGLKVRAGLLDPRIELPLDRTVAAEHVARDIEKAVEDRDGQDRSAETERAFGGLFEWILANREAAEGWFSDAFLSSIYRTLRHDADHLASYHAQQTLKDIEHKIKAAGFGSTEDLLTAFERLKEAGTSGSSTETDGKSDDDPFGTDVREIAAKAVDLWVVIRQALLDEGGTLEGMALRDLAWWREHYPSLFEHVTVSALEKYLEWLVLLEEAKRGVKAKLEADPSYDIAGADWHGADDFPTIIPGVFRLVPSEYGAARERIDFVVRPAHGGGVILYWKEERELLRRPRAELWAAGGGYKARPVTLGALAEALNLRRIPLTADQATVSISTN